MSAPPRDLVWFVNRGDDGTLEYCEQVVEFVGGLLVGDYDWCTPGIEPDDLAVRVAGGIDSSLDDGEWDARVVAAGWVFGRPEWWPPIAYAD